MCVDQVPLPFAKPKRRASQKFTRKRFCGTCVGAPCRDRAECKRLRESKRRSEDRDRIREYKRTWQADNADRTREHRNESARRRRRSDPDKNYFHHIKRYGLSRPEYERMMLEQGGVCAICKKSNRGKHRMSVDHCHVTGRVRGILCGTCNAGIGQLRDDPSVCRAAAEYLDKHRG